VAPTRSPFPGLLSAGGERERRRRGNAATGGGKKTTTQHGWWTIGEDGARLHRAGESG